VFTFNHHRKSRSQRRGVEEFKEDYMLQSRSMQMRKLRDKIYIEVLVFRIIS
jgi:hypothetical protein